jgi:hypothetical protein
MDWQTYVDAALTDIRSALNDEEKRAADHLRDAMANIGRALEALEDEE